MLAASSKNWGLNLTFRGSCGVWSLVKAGEQIPKRRAEIKCEGGFTKLSRVASTLRGERGFKVKKVLFPLLLILVLGLAACDDGPVEDATDELNSVPAPVIQTYAAVPATFNIL